MDVTKLNPSRLNDRIRKLAAEDLRSMISETGVQLKEIADAPGVPGVSALSRYQNGDKASFMGRLYSFVLGCRYAGVARSEVMRLVEGLETCIHLVYGPPDEQDVEEAMLAFSEADMAEEPAEREVWREGLSFPALLRYRPFLRAESATARTLELCIRGLEIERAVA
jgi:hypothetical protein